MIDSSLSDKVKHVRANAQMEDYYGGYEDYGDWDGFLDDDYLVAHGDEVENAVDAADDKEANDNSEAPQIPVPALDSDGDSSSDPGAGREEDKDIEEHSGTEEGEHGKAGDEMHEEEEHEKPFVVS